MESRRSSIFSDEDEDRSSATSLSTQETSPSQPKDPLQEGNDFLSDISNYLALGCLCLQIQDLPGNQSLSDVWRRLDDVASLPGLDGPLRTCLETLHAARWILLSSWRSLDRNLLIVRVYLLPFDVGHRYVDRQSKRLHVALEALIEVLDISKGTWNGEKSHHDVQKFDLFATQDEGSLFWMFNTLPSPSLCASSVHERYAREALEDVLEPDLLLPGLRTQLLPYQRRSAGLMIQREAVSELCLDPRLEQRTGPDGSMFYFGARDFVFLRHPRYYETCRGGILAETMGLGKTLICLATVLATKDQPPIVPAVCSLPPVRVSVGSLKDMAISTINRKSVSWRVELSRVQNANGGVELESIRNTLDSNPAIYEVPVEPVRWNRNTIQPPPKRMILSTATLIVVPRNLCKQWQSEIQKHLETYTLRVLVMDDTKKPLPSTMDLKEFDLILFTRGRFEMEIKDGADNQGRRLASTQLLCRCPYIGATRIRDCHCLQTDDLYDSPLKHLHFKRLIIDEGHFFSNNNAAAVTVANKLITADHRWIVSGTPAPGLLGAEVDADMAAAVDLYSPETQHAREAILQQRRHFSKKDDTIGAIKSLGALATHFLRMKPWYTPSVLEKRVEWDEYVFRHESSRGRTYSGYASCLRRMLNAMVVKTQPADVEKDIALPPLSHKVVYLKPSFYDKLTANLFALVLTANAITSERTDVDYLFHRNSSKARSQLFANLRSSPFSWTGFSEADVLAVIKSSNGYLTKEGTSCSEADRALLSNSLKCTDTILDSQGWKALSLSHEIGLYVMDWPAESAEHWSFEGSSTPLLTGVSQLLEAQRHVNFHVHDADPGEGLAGAGIKALAPAKHGSNKTDEDEKDEKAAKLKAVPQSGLESASKRRGSFSRRGDKGSPKKSPKSPKAKHELMDKSEATSPEIKRSAGRARSRPGVMIEESATTPVKPETIEDYLPTDSAFLHSRIVGTTSAKLSYLLSQILNHYQQVKILVFFDSENHAYYISQALELLHIRHEIYAKSLPAHLKAEYVVRFDQDPEVRVMLMDVRNAAYGLNLPSASRIYFINPVCRPNIEAQAVKRAHRIGQTRPVYVETLILSGTIEEKMLERSKRMTRTEHHDAKALEDDGGIRKIIQEADMLPISDNERVGSGQMAPLDVSQQLWTRPGWTSFMPRASAKMPDITAKKRCRDGNTEQQNDLKVRIVRRKLDFVDCTTTEPPEPDARIQDSNDEPIARRRRRDCIDSPLSTKTNAHSIEGTTPPSATRALSILTQPEHVELPSPDIELIERQGRLAVCTEQYRKMPIFRLLKQDIAKDPRASDQMQLVHQILQRL